MKRQEDALIVENVRLKGDYCRVRLATTRIAGEVAPGQFVHVQFPTLEHRVLRRPFSVCDASPETGELTIIYKVVGEGTRHLVGLPTGQCLNLIGPLGNGFSLPADGETAIIVAGGYGAAATFLLAKQSHCPCHVLLGARSAADLLLTSEFEALGATLEVATDDGSVGHRGFVTELLDAALTSARSRGKPRVYACGPNAMLEAVARIVEEKEAEAEVSLDHAMCCGVGACLACVVKKKADTADGWEYVRTCKDGPVFRSGSLWRE